MIPYIQNFQAGVALTAGFFMAGMFQQTIWRLEMEQPTKPSTWSEQVKWDYIVDRARELLQRLQQAGAQFYAYGACDVMLLRGQLIDLSRTSELLLVLKSCLQEDQRRYAREVAQNIHFFAKQSMQCIPCSEEGAGGIRNYLSFRDRIRIMEYFESERLSQTQGDTNED
ncbi:MAG TPA: hypothetical protein VGL38_05920 [bacterium]|jgi:hypothetical protein